ncbi:MAG TPA: hypothetical protein VES19_08020, partial [Candidatus Limnocylindrales bacterium]|nr:hypothetical protein [Candidatus Limnocylindrales bacterium]
TAADGPWGELLAACRAAVDDPGEPVAVVAVVAEPPSRVRLEHRGREPLELGLGALVVAIRWGGPGLATTWAEVRVTEGVVVAGPGWSRTLDVVAVSDPAPGAVPGGTASLSARDEGAWIPVSLTEPPPDG